MLPEVPFCQILAHLICIVSMFYDNGLVNNKGIISPLISSNKSFPARTKDKIPVHEICNNVVCTISKASDQPAHTRSLIRAIASRLSIL